MIVEVFLSERLRVRKADLPLGHESQIKQRLTVPNGDKVAALKRNQWGADDLPDSFALYQDDGAWLVMPRGYAAELCAGLEHSGHSVRLVDKTSATSLLLDEFVHHGPTLRDDQEKACMALLHARQGVLEAPTSGGKTVTVLEAWRRSGLRGLILVEKTGLAKQWIERAREHLGVEAGMIGEGEWDEQPLTVAMLQTLYRRDLSPFWWRRWGFTTMDEVHHSVASTYQDVVKQVCSRYLVGVTATPLEGEWTQPLLTHVIGPIFHITTPETLRRAGLRMTPLVRRVRTGWRWEPNEQEAKLVDTKAIYRHLIAQLEHGGGSTDRVGIIARTILDQPLTCAQLVVSKRLGSLDRIREALEAGGYEGSIYDYRGSVPGDERTEIAKLVDSGGCVILATVADEGVDISRLDRLHLVWPARKALTLTQQIGRVLRMHPDKREVVIYDYVDDEGMLQAQAQARLRVYRQAGYPIEEQRPMQASFTE
jgi:superfamily II DNA or RNA helicase